MVTRITSPFSFVPVSGEFLERLLVGAGIGDVTVGSVSQFPGGLEVETNRHLTAPEKETLRQVLLGAIISFTDVS